jgi:hypothetical protein
MSQGVLSLLHPLQPSAIQTVFLLSPVPTPPHRLGHLAQVERHTAISRAYPTGGFERDAIAQMRSVLSSSIWSESAKRIGSGAEEKQKKLRVLRACAWHVSRFSVGVSCCLRCRSRWSARYRQLPALHSTGQPHLCQTCQVLQV